MFSGTYVYTVDPKGRVTMPMKFRSLLGEPFVLTKGLGGCLLAMSAEHWDRVLERYSGAVTFQRFYLAAAHDARAHPRTGRFLVPAPLREFAKVRPGQDVSVVGIGDGVEIWDKARWDKLARDLPRGICRQDSTFELSVPDTGDHTPFHISSRELFGVPVLECGGEPDASSATGLWEALVHAHSRGPGTILDVRSVTRLDTMLAGMRFQWPEERWENLLIVAPEGVAGFFDQYLGFSRLVFSKFEDALWYLQDGKAVVTR